jgi:molybdate transport system regulatory protein
VRIRVDFSEGCAVGPGKIELLEAIVRAGSLSVAARDIGMSYRRAWDLVDDLNQSFSTPLVTTMVGGTQGGGARLTAHGRELVRRFRALEVATRRLAARQMRSIGERAA